MAIVSDSGPLIALERIQQLPILPRLFGQILVPPAVQREFGSTLRALDWLVIQPPSGPPRLATLDVSLGAGEREALELSLQIGAARLLVDDKAARKVARTLHLPIVGTLGLLLAAKRRGLLPGVRPCLDALRKASFHMTADLYRRVIKEAGEG